MFWQDSLKTGQLSVPSRSFTFMAETFLIILKMAVEPSVGTQDWVNCLLMPVVTVTRDKMMCWNHAQRNPFLKIQMFVLKALVHGRSFCSSSSFLPTLGAHFCEARKGLLLIPGASFPRSTIWVAGEMLMACGSWFKQGPRGKVNWCVSIQVVENRGHVAERRQAWTLWLLGHKVSQPPEVARAKDSPYSHRGRKFNFKGNHHSREKASKYSLRVLWETRHLAGISKFT